MAGNAGIALGAMHAGDPDLALLAGVLALPCDRAVECQDPAARDEALEFARVLVDDLDQHATTAEFGVCRADHEHRATPSVLEPEPAGRRAVPASSAS